MIKLHQATWLFNFRCFFLVMFCLMFWTINYSGICWWGQWRSKIGNEIEPWEIVGASEICFISVYFMENPSINTHKYVCLFLIFHKMQLNNHMFFLHIFGVFENEGLTSTYGHLHRENQDPNHWGLGSLFHTNSRFFCS